jgi:hypothetical protein
MPAKELAARIAAFDEPSGAAGPRSGTTPRDVCAIEDPEQAIEHALGVADTVCVAGSIFLAGAVRDGLRRRAILR